MGFDATEKSLAKLLNDAIYWIPRNQRKYVWKKEHWNDLWTDTIFAANNKTTHFLGSIVLKREEEQQGLECFTIIDGQQRMMTITIFLTAIMLHFKKMDLEDDFKGTEKYLKAIDNKNNTKLIFDSDYHESLKILTNSIFNLTHTEASDVTLGGFVDSKIISKRRDKIVGDCFKFYYSSLNQRLQDDEENFPEFLISVRDALISMSYVHIVATTDEDSYTIFEILNARGQSLGDHELIKNYIMRYIEPVNNRDRVKVVWEEMENLLGGAISKFITHYAIHRFNTPDELRSEPYKNIKKSTMGQNMDDLLTDLRLKSEYYAKLINPIKNDADGNELCNDNELKIFRFFKSNRFEQFRPVLLSLMHQRDKDVLGQEKYNNILTFMYNFFICYTIIGRERSNRLTDIAYKSAPLLENNFSEQELDKFVSSLQSKIPNQSWFINAFRNLGWSRKWGIYNDEKEKARVQLVLEIIEMYLRKTDECPVFTIEHILPDNEDENFAKIGNLLPLEENLNGRCDDKPFEVKAEIYAESSFKSVNRLIERYKEFNPESIDKRTEYLARMFYEDILSQYQSKYQPA